MLMIKILQNICFFRQEGRKEGEQREKKSRAKFSKNTHIFRTTELSSVISTTIASLSALAVCFSQEKKLITFILFLYNYFEEEWIRKWREGRGAR